MPKAEPSILDPEQADFLASHKIAALATGRRESRQLLVSSRREAMDFMIGAR